MTRVSRAASTTSAVIVWRWLIRLIWANERCRRRKLPLVVREIAATASGVGEVLERELEAAALPVVVEDEMQLVAAQRPVLMREPDAAVELGSVPGVSPSRACRSAPGPAAGGQRSRAAAPGWRSLAGWPRRRSRTRFEARVSALERHQPDR